jgi:hypothetical protein
MTILIIGVRFSPHALFGDIAGLFREASAANVRVVEAGRVACP